MSTGWQRFAWCLYDFANSGFPTVIITAVYIIYFKDVVVGAGSPGESDRLWGMANSVGAAIVFLLAPVLGAVADTSGRQHLFWIVSAYMCMVGTAVLAFTGTGTVVFAMVAFVVALVGFEGSCVFYNSFLPMLVPRNKMERLSGSAWGLGYIGGLGCLLICLPLALNGAYLHLVPMVVAAWFAVFSLPAFWSLRTIVPQQKRSLRWRDGVRYFATCAAAIGQQRNLARFLIAFFFFNNAVATIIVFAVAFSKDSLAFTTGQSIALVVVMNLIAAPGAYGFGRVAEKVGSRSAIVATLLMWLVVVIGAQAAAWPGLFTTEGAKTLFWGVAALASLCIGATQATSRTFVGQMAPAGRSGEYYGYMAFAGKGSAILGPAVFGWISGTFHSQRLAVLSIGVFFLIGLVAMSWVKDD